MSTEIVGGDLGEVFFFNDLLYDVDSEGHDDSDPIMWNGREIVIKPIKNTPHIQHLLAMMRAPDRGSVSGGYSQEKGANVQFEIEWDFRSQDNSTSKEKEKESPSREDKSSRQEESPKEVDFSEQDEDSRSYLVINMSNATKYRV